LPLDVAFSVCPHDCPSACALEVERIDATRIGRIRGARAQGYTTASSAPRSAAMPSGNTIPTA